MIYAARPGVLTRGSGGWDYEGRGLRYEVDRSTARSLPALRRILARYDRTTAATVDPRQDVNVQDVLDVTSLLRDLGFETIHFSGTAENF